MTGILPQYRDEYPGQGDVAVLCEGDVIGYECGILKRWLPSQIPGRPFADVWACGTSDALYGMSDALGRSCPIIAVEDRDYRRPDQAEEDCEKRKKDRQHRGVQIVDWVVWHRNEIENYLLENAVLLPVMQKAFSCEEHTVKDALRQVIRAMPVFQAFKHAIYQMRRMWGESDVVRHLSNLPEDLSVRPSWDDDKDDFCCADPDAVAAGLRENLSEWRGCFAEDSSDEALAPNEWANVFPEKHDLWKDVPVESDVWRVEWAGKEILHCLLVVLTHRYGRPGSGAEREAMAWNSMPSRKKRDEKLREIEGTLAPYLMRGFVRHLENTEGGPVAEEWRDLAQAVRVAGPALR